MRKYFLIIFLIFSGFYFFNCIYNIRNRFEVDEWNRIDSDNVEILEWNLNGITFEPADASSTGIGIEVFLETIILLDDVLVFTVTPSDRTELKGNAFVYNKMELCSTRYSRPVDVFDCRKRYEKYLKL